MSKLYVVATPIGNLSDLSPRAKQVLSECALIAAEDTRHTIKLLNHFEIKTPLESYHKFNEKSKAESLVSRMLSEEFDVALVSDAGTPCISDPGHELVSLARANDIPVYAIVGPSAITAALSVCGYEPESFAFFGFLPRDKKPLRETLLRMKSSPVSLLVLYESPRRIIKTAEILGETFEGAQFCFCCELTKLHEKYFRGSISDVLERLRADPYGQTGEYCIVINRADRDDKYKDGRQTDSFDNVDSDNMGSTEVPALTPEAQIVEIMAAQNLTLRYACAQLQATGTLSRNRIYKAALNLRRMINEE